MNSNKGLKIAAKRGVKLRQGSQFVFKGRQVGWNLQGGLKIHIHLTVMGQVKLDRLPAWQLGALRSSWYQHWVQPSLEAACQTPCMCSGVIQQPQRLCKIRGKSRQQRLSLQHSGVLFSLKFTSAQQPGTRIPWRPDLLLLPSGKAEFQIDLPVLPSRCCRGMTSKLKTA